MENTSIAAVFDELADLLNLRGGNRFRIRAYRVAAQTIRGLPRRLEDMVADQQNLAAVPNLGESMAGKIVEIIETGHCRRLEDLRKKVPSGLTEVMHVPEVGPRKATQLFKELHIKSLEDLRNACEKHKIRELAGMGAKTEANILKGIKTLETTAGRILLKEATDQVETIGRHLDQIKLIDQWRVAGSFRRGRETIGDLDFLIQTRKRKETTEQILKLRDIGDLLRRGEERVTVRLTSGLQLDFRFVEPKSLGSALIYFTGSKAHSIALRKLARKRKWKLNEYGLFKDGRQLEGKTEKAVYERLKLPWIPPEIREDRGEIEAAVKDAIPQLVEQNDLRGDLHCHTEATDGANTIREMARSARDLGYDYLAITDHSQAVTVANGLNESRLRKHVSEIRQVGQSLKGFTLLAGVEVDIRRSGKLDLNEKALAELDWVVASIHSHFSLTRKQMTDRLLAAIKSGVVHCLGHPLGRLLGRRDPIEIDMEKVFAACHEHRVFVEVNAQPDRLDLPDSYCQQAREAGVRFTIVTDAHKQSDLELIRYGVIHARRGWLTRPDVLNTVGASELRKRIQRK